MRQDEVSNRVGDRLAELFGELMQGKASLIQGITVTEDVGYVLDNIKMSCRKEKKIRFVL